MPGRLCGNVAGLGIQSRAIGRQRISKLKSEPVPEEELNRSKAQLKGSLMLSLESSTSRMSNLARQEMYFDRFYDLDELIAKIEAVTAEDLTSLANEFFKTESVAVTALGNLNGLKITRDQLAC